MAKKGVGTWQRKQLSIDKLHKPSGHRQKVRVAIKARINGLSEHPAAGRGPLLIRAAPKCRTLTMKHSPFFNPSEGERTHHNYEFCSASF